MIKDLPIWIELLFMLALLATIAFFHFSNGRPKKATTLIVVWSLIQGVLAYTGFYQTMDTMPPRFGLVLIPATFVMVYGLLPKQQKWFSENRDINISTFLHSVRLPVELVLLGLFTHGMVPELMTFEGRNLDILMGITAPIIGILWLKKKMGKRTLLAWNVVGLTLVLFILFNGILSSELPFQQFGFEQPNRGITFFPFVLLPATIVPVVIWTHLSDIVILRKALRAAS